MYESYTQGKKIRNRQNGSSKSTQYSHLQTQLRV